MTDAVRIDICRQFSDVPAGRYYRDGKFTGQKFREEFVRPYLDDGRNVVLNIDGVESLPSSFWEEVFGGLIRAGYSESSVRNRISVETTEPILARYKALAWKFVDEEVARQH